jgi:hypothetical protein
MKGFLLTAPELKTRARGSFPERYAINKVHHPIPATDQRSVSSLQRERICIFFIKFRARSGESGGVLRVFARAVVPKSGFLRGTIHFFSAFSKRLVHLPTPLIPLRHFCPGEKPSILIPQQLPERLRIFWGFPAPLHPEGILLLRTQ